MGKPLKVAQLVSGGAGTRPLALPLQAVRGEPPAGDALAGWRGFGQNGPHAHLPRAGGQAPKGTGILG